MTREMRVPANASLLAALLAGSLLVSTTPVFGAGPGAEAPSAAGFPGVDFFELLGEIATDDALDTSGAHDRTRAARSGAEESAQSAAWIEILDFVMQDDAASGDAGANPSASTSSDKPGCRQGGSGGGEPS